jgi:DNA-nicking Smr family endonuclease
VADDDGVVEIPITGELDLHSFAPRDVPSVVSDYLDECGARGLTLVRLIHGRGKGVQRAVVRRLLSQRADVLAFEDAPPPSGGWGSTCVWLRGASAVASEQRGEE